MNAMHQGIIPQPILQLLVASGEMSDKALTSSFSQEL